MSGKEVIAEVVGRALDTAKDNPDMRAAGSALGVSLRIVAETVRTALLPLAVANLGVRKFEDYLRGKFADELDEATASIPEESLQEPPLNIAGPVMQGLAYTHESEELRRMFLALLATSMDSSKASTAHPAFADIVRQLDPSEAIILGAILKMGGSIDIVRFHRLIHEPRATVLLQEHVLPLWVDTDRFATVSAAQAAAYVENWIRLGLIEVDYQRPFAAPHRYAWVDEWPITRRLRDREGDDLLIGRGTLTLTMWGQKFGEAIDVDGQQFDAAHFNAAPRDPEVPAKGPQVIDGGSA